MFKRTYIFFISMLMVSGSFAQGLPGSGGSSDLGDKNFDFIPLPYINYTHLGCLVGYDSFNNKLVCPCHAGEFDLEGNVLSGPATKSLKRYPLKISSKQITIG